MNASKTKVMKINRTHHPKFLNNIQVNGEALETVSDFIYLGAKIAATYDDSGEIKRRPIIAKSAVISLTCTWKDSHISLSTNKRLLSSLVFSIATHTYGSECRVVKKKDLRRIEPFKI